MLNSKSEYPISGYLILVNSDRLMKFIAIVLIASFALAANAQNSIPSKSEVDAVLQNAVKKANAQMSGSKVDEYTTLRFLTYDVNPPLLSYFYATSVMRDTNQSSLNQSQIDAIRNFNINKSCSTYGLIMKHYNLRVAHIFDDSYTGKPIYKITVSRMDC
jgi:hypothetical protein